MGLERARRGEYCLSLSGITNNPEGSLTHPRSYVSRFFSCCYVRPSPLNGVAYKCKMTIHQQLLISIVVVVVKAHQITESFDSPTWERTNFYNGAAFKSFSRHAIFRQAEYIVSHVIDNGSMRIELDWILPKIFSLEEIRNKNSRHC